MENENYNNDDNVPLTIAVASVPFFNQGEWGLVVWLDWIRNGRSDLVCPIRFALSLPPLFWKRGRKVDWSHSLHNQTQLSILCAGSAWARRGRRHPGKRWGRPTDRFSWHPRPCSGLWGRKKQLTPACQKCFRWRSAPIHICVCSPAISQPRPGDGLELRREDTVHGKPISVDYHGKMPFWLDF